MVSRFGKEDEAFDSWMSQAVPMTKVGVPNQELVGYVIGKGGRTIKRLVNETSTAIKYSEDTNEFVIEGEAENRYAAKLKLKEVINNGLNRQTDNYKWPWRFSFVDPNSSGFMLEPVGMTSSAFKVVMKDPFYKDSSQTTDYSSFSSKIISVLQSIHEERKNDAINNIWSHFGHIHVSNVNLDKTDAAFDAQQLMCHLERNIPANASNSKWRTKFVGGIAVDGIESHNLKEWMSTTTEKGFPFMRYEYVYFAPSCRMIRVKIFLALDVRNNTVTCRNIPKCEPVANIIKSSDNYPYFYLCGSTVKRAMVDVFQPAEELDFRFIIASGLKFQAPVDENEVDTLFNFIHENVRFIPSTGIELLDDNLPSDFDLCYSRVAERRTYPLTSEDGEQFTVKLSYEYTVNTSETTYGTTVDIHLKYDEWDKMLEDGTWTPQKIVDKTPQFMKCASNLARFLKVPGTIPTEVRARGPKAQEAYEIALKSGKEKYCRVLLALVGQSGAGKTSLLRSLRGEKFNPEEDSTDGVRLHRSLSKVEADMWHEDDNFESCLVDRTARAVARNLSSSFNGVRELTSTPENDKDEPLNQDPDEEIHEQKVESRVEENSKGLDVEDTRVENKREIALTEESAEEKRSTLSDPVFIQENRKDNPIPEEVSKRTTNILKNPEEQEVEDNVHFVALDFAGQPVYNATHPVFLPKKAIYILVNSLENEIHDKATPTVKHGSLRRKVDDPCPMTNMDHLEVWLSFVSSLWTTEGVSIIDDNALGLLERAKKAPRQKEKSTTKEVKLPRRQPPVFLVCTHADIPLLKGTADPKEMAREIFSYLKHKNESPGGNHIVRGIYAVNNTVSGESEREEESVKQLRTHIYQLARKLPYVNDVVPLRWLHFEKQLSELATNSNKKYISMEEAKNVAVKCNIDVTTEEFNTVLNYLHDLKVIIHFEDTKIVIIDIQWLLDMIVKVITVQPDEDWEDEYEKQWKRLENDGILERSLIDHVWDNETTASSLLMIMEKFSLLCCWKRSGLPDIFLVPSMLMNSDAKAADDLLSDKKTARTLVVRFKSAHLPLGIFPRLLVIIAKTCNEKWPDSPKPKFYHNFCRFYDVGDVGDSKKSFDLVVTSDIKTISFSVINEQGIIGLPLKQLCRFIVEFVSKTLKVMRSSFPWMKNADHEFCIRCPKCHPSSEFCKCHNVSGCTRDTCLHFITKEKLCSKQPRCYRKDTSKSTFFEEEIICDWFDVSRHEDDVAQETSTTSSVAAVVEQQLALDGKPSTSKVSKSNEIVPYAVQSRDLSLPETPALSIAEFQKLLEELKPYKKSMKDPPAETVKRYRDICRQIKGVRRQELIKTLRDYVPDGTTGPLEMENKLYAWLDPKKKQHLTRALCGQDILRRIVDEFGKSKFFDYYNRDRNPVEALLEDVNKERNLTIGELYDVIVKCEANAVADDYL